MSVGIEIAECLDVETVAAYAGHGLDRAEVLRVDTHVAECSPCRRMLSELARLQLDVSGSATSLVSVGRDGERVLLRGATVGRYVIEELLGAGGMGVVYAARDSQLERRVALKMVRRGATDDEAMQARLLREAKAMAKLSHPNVVAIHDVGFGAGDLFIAMELVQGMSLKAWLLEEARPWQRVLEVFIEAGRGLAAAHAVGLVHRDFKPSNVLYGESGRVYVTDLGLARLTAAAEITTANERVRLPIPTTSTETLTGSIVGTPAYMAPEQHRGLPADERSDQYSFCLALYEALYQRLPFAGASPSELAEAKARGALRPPPASRVSSRVRRALERGLEVDPTRRHASMDALISELTENPRRRRRIAAIAAAAALLGVVAIFVHLARARDRDLRASCAREGEAIGKVWDAARKKRSSAAFQKVGSPFAEQAWPGVDAALGRYANQWQSARTGVCVGALARPARTASDNDGQVLCLDDRLRDFEAVANELTAVTTTSGAASAVLVSETLEPVQACERASHRAPQPAGGDPAKLEELRRGLARAKALRYFGKDAEAAAVARELTSSAEALGDQPLLARLFLEASLANRSNRLIDAAERDGYRAASLADAAGDDLVRAKAWSNLLVLVGYFRGDAMQSARIYDQAMATVARADGDRLLEADVRAAHAVVLLGQRKYAETAEEAGRAAAAYEHADASVALVDALRNQCLAEKRLGRLDEARRLCERALSVMSAAVGDSHPTVGRILSNLAPVLLEQGDSAAAHAAARRAVLIYDAVADTEGPNVNAAVAMAALGDALLGLERHSEALASFERSLAILERTPMVPNVRGRALSGLGRAHVGIGHTDQAIAILERVLAAPGDVEPDSLAYASFALARALSKREPERARLVARQAQDRLEREGTRSPFQEAVRGRIEAWLLGTDGLARAAP
jgi:eukaryotic-like serine/threonine-protein kinase